LKIAITGSNGFLGAHLVKQALSAGHETIALVRSGADLRRLPDSTKLSIEPIDYSSKNSINQSIKTVKAKFGEIDVLIHNAGLTVTIHPANYFNINSDITKRLLDAVREFQLLSSFGTWMQISSYAAQGPTGHDKPVSAYGHSKLAAETHVKESEFRHLIFRPTGIYGSGDSAFLPMFKAAKFGIFALLAPTNQRITMIHGSDLSAFVLSKVGYNGANEIYHLSDGHVYGHMDFKSALEKAFKKKLLTVRVPQKIIRGWLSFSDFISSKAGLVPAVTLEKYNEISQDWDLSSNPDLKHPRFENHYTLEKGFEEAYNYYKSVNLL
jgi:UDP-glucose 4-epimerase